MESRFKERITGAAVLIALIVVVVPELFRGQRGAPPAPTSSGGDGPPVRSYTIDLNTNSSHAPLRTEGPAGLTGDAAPPAPASGSTAAAAPGTQTAAPAARSSPRAAPGSPPPPASAQPQAQVTPAPTMRGPAGWDVQLGIFSSHDNALRMSEAARGKGFDASVSGADAKGLFRVRIANLADRAVAEQQLQRLKVAGFAGTIQAPP